MEHTDVRLEILDIAENNFNEGDYLKIANLLKDIRINKKEKCPCEDCYKTDVEGYKYEKHSIDTMKTFGNLLIETLKDFNTKIVIWKFSKYLNDWIVAERTTKIELLKKHFSDFNQDTLLCSRFCYTFKKFSRNHLPRMEFQKLPFIYFDDVEEDYHYFDIDSLTKSFITDEIQVLKEGKKWNTFWAWVKNMKGLITDKSLFETIIDCGSSKKTKNETAKNLTIGSDLYRRLAIEWDLNGIKKNTDKNEIIPKINEILTQNKLN